MARSKTISAFCHLPWLGCLMLSLLSIGIVRAATPLDGAWRTVHAGDTPQQVLQDFHDGTLTRFDPAMLQQFPRSNLGSWVVLAPQPPWIDEERVLAIYPPPAGVISVYPTATDVVAPLSRRDFSTPIHGHGRLAWYVPTTQLPSAPIVLKFEPTAAVAAPVRFDLQPWGEYLQKDANWLVFATACFAVMLAMVLMALCFSLMLRDVTYAWYAGYILCYALIQAAQSGFLFHPLEWHWLDGITPALEAIATAASVAFASLFMVRFCELQRYAPLLRVLIGGLAVCMAALVVMQGSRVELLQQRMSLLLNPLLLLGATLLSIAAIIAAARGSRHAWFFLVGWVPLLALTAISSAQMNGALSSLGWINQAALGVGAFEAIVLSLGLADRALVLRRDRDTVRVLAERDMLTNAFNRRAWIERAEKALAGDPPQSLAALFLDLDHFKQLNDHHGHSAGDHALTAVAAALETELRPTDVFGRYGGEEFVVLLTGATVAQAMQVATRLCRRVHRLEIPVDEGEQRLTISIGIAMRVDGDTVASLVDRADQAMYKAKLGGRNRTFLHRVATPHSARPRLHIIDGNGR